MTILKPRDLQILEQVVNGLTYQQIAQRNSVSASRVQQVWRSTVKIILRDCFRSGTPEDFYPGSDADNRAECSKEFRYVKNPYWNIGDKLSDKHTEISLCIIAGKVDDIETVRQYKNFWLHQINKRQHRKIK